MRRGNEILAIAMLFALWNANDITSEGKKVD
jgi:hypothetical protein